MEIRIKKLSKNEKYACSIKEIKRVFQDDSIFISFGYLGKSFSFDSTFINHPVINGLIICSLSFTRRLNHTTDTEPYLCFYVVRDDKYSERYEREFCDIILPQIEDWLIKIHSQPDTPIPGVEQLLVEWTGKEFNIHQSRFK